jgi:preprotein translocase subunit SecE
LVFGENMEDNKNQKMITMSFLTMGILTALVVSILLESAAATWGAVAKYYSEDLIKHGLPVVLGLIVFVVLQSNKKVQIWADEVVTELLKVVWPSRRDTIAMTVVVGVMVLISSLIIGFFDFLSSSIIKFVLNMKI